MVFQSGIGAYLCDRVEMFDLRSLTLRLCKAKAQMVNGNLVFPIEPSAVGTKILVSEDGRVGLEKDLSIIRTSLAERIAGLKS